MTRLTAFLIHLGISLIIFLVLCYLLFFVWYPDFFFTTDGGWQGLRIIFLVDIVLGPMITLVVFNPSKPASELRRDLSIVGVFQLTCLVFGTAIVYSERPLALVFADGQFFSMSADDYAEAGVQPDLDRFAGAYPIMLMVDLPSDPVEQSRIRRDAYRNGKPIRAMVARYQPFRFAASAVARESIDGQVLLERRPEKVKAWLQSHGGAMEDYAFFPFAARYSYQFLGIERKSGRIEGILDVDRLAESP